MATAQWAKATYHPSEVEPNGTSGPVSSSHSGRLDAMNLLVAAGVAWLQRWTYLDGFHLLLYIILFLML